MKIAIMGFGVVGSGVAEVLAQNSISIAKKANEKIELVSILDIRKFDDSRFSHLLTKSMYDVINSGAQIIVETIGGTTHAYQYTKMAFEKGIHVVTSNKELVSKKGPELLALAKEHKVNYLFEASVGGGIPIIRPLEQCLAANEIYMIAGILNGTTNYILTKMREENLDFTTALYQAQQIGYAEADPTDDIEGYDTKRKIAILSSIAYGKFVDADMIPVKGIADIDAYDMSYSKALGTKIKLVGQSRLLDGKISAVVEPLMINAGEYLSTVDDVFNAILVKGDAIGEAMFYGRGAGKLPTASAVIADVVYITKNKDVIGKYDWSETLEHISESGSGRYFIRIVGEDHETAEKLSGGTVILGIKENEFGLVTNQISEENLKQLEGQLDVIKAIRYMQT